MERIGCWFLFENKMIFRFKHLWNRIVLHTRWQKRKCLGVHSMNVSRWRPVMGVEQTWNKLGDRHLSSAFDLIWCLCANKVKSNLEKSIDKTFGLIDWRGGGEGGEEGDKFIRWNPLLYQTVLDKDKHLLLDTLVDKLNDCTIEKPRRLRDGKMST